MKQRIQIIIIAIFTASLILSACKGVFNNPPDNVYLWYPENNSTYDSIPYKLEWTCHDSNRDKLIYESYFGTDNSPELFKSNLEKVQYTDELPVQSNKTYYWKVIAEDEFGEKSETQGNEKIESFIEIENIADKLKEEGTNHWNSPNGTNER